MNNIIKKSDFKKYKCIALMGGTFNPIHNGHLLLAQNAMEQYEDIDKVIFLPNNKPAYKSDKELIKAKDRLEMISLAVSDMDYALVSDIEIKRGEITYSIDTLNELLEINPELKIYFIIGADSLFTIRQWRRWDELLSKCIILAARRNSDYSEMKSYAKNLMRDVSGADIRFIIMDEIDISSTKLREEAEFGDYAYLQEHMPAKAYEYVMEHEFYK